mgnify:CR=1 FL=1
MTAAGLFIDHSPSLAASEADRRVAEALAQVPEYTAFVRVAGISGLMANVGGLKSTAPVAARGGWQDGEAGQPRPRLSALKMIMLRCWLMKDWTALASALWRN